ncbi:hypothetical protein ALO83_103529 [Pseudomonas cannabina pv. alisalensis]|uniref:Uncharacterized protein n=1 Tax=Pseudomonas cannabina TaxID=86840 RepID=A0A3M3RTX4_PSECA|nr:Unknown protein sequence [Pseudomonas syringae pv. maculicola]KPW21990.1 hypothetical protein ALO83_103529 [Pseudomonas cannabina pv. alisalensis]RMN99856.1 hypothetical protein ALQ51_102019 [Pseudomonas cannabina]
MRSPLEQVPRRNAYQETHPRKMTGHDKKMPTRADVLPGHPAG